jgi:hypothetical protein
MANVRGKSIDNTHLSIDTAEDRILVHRDYISHCIRWSHVIKFLLQKHAYKNVRVLDIGCGVDAPLARMMLSNRIAPIEYIGIDYNHSSKFNLDMFKNTTFKPTTFGSVDFANDHCVWFDNAKNGELCMNIKGDNAEDYFAIPNLITCFEVLEHIEPEHVIRVLMRVKYIMEKTKEFHGYTPTFFMSTPNWNVTDTADNHVNEMKNEALGWLLEEVGFKIVDQFGTFASKRDYAHLIQSRYGNVVNCVFDRLNDYFDSNLASILFAPLFPREARNCFWKLSLADESYERKYAPISELAEPWTSSENWKDLANV